MKSERKSTGKLFKQPIFLLIFFTLISIVMSFGACLVQNAGFSVRITKGVVNMDHFYQERYGGVAPASRPERMNIGDNGDGMVNAKRRINFIFQKPQVKIIQFLQSL